MCSQLVCTYLSIRPMCMYVQQECRSGMCMYTSYPRSLRSQLAHVTHQSAVCSPQRGSSGGRAEECSLCAILGHTSCSGSVTTAVHGCAFASFTCMDYGCRHVFMFPCVCVPLLCRCTRLLIAHFRTTTSCLQLQMNGTTLGERANLLSREFVYKWATTGRRLSLFDIVRPL